MRVLILIVIIVILSSIIFLIHNQIKNNIESLDNIKYYLKDKNTNKYLNLN